jgi:site-specific DNA-methyltransferase (adenine-specific)
MEDYINKVTHCDCVQGMERFPEGSIDLVVTSPPYDDLRQYQGYNFCYESVAKGLFRVLRPGGVVVWVVGDETVGGSETGTSFKQALYFKEIGFNLHDTMIYMRNSVKHPDLTRYYNCFQYMFVFSKGKPTTINLIKDHKNKTAGKKETSKLQREKDGSWATRASVKKVVVRPEYSVRWNIWTYDVGSLVMAEDRLWVGHPAIFPLKLPEDHIKSWTNENDIVFDPMCGSGQTLIAAKKLNRRFVGMDICEDYCELSRKRLELY